MGPIAIAILAAGRGSRFQGNSPKPLAVLEGRSLLDRALTAALNSSLDPVLLITGYQAQQVAKTVPPGVQVIHNPHWSQGIATSLRAALQHLQADPLIEALCVGLADQPLVGAAAYRRLAEAYQEGAEFAVATYNGARRNPVLLARSLWPAAMALQGDEGARVLMKTYPIVEVPCDRTGNPLDVDTAEDLQTLATGSLVASQVSAD